MQDRLNESEFPISRSCFQVNLSQSLHPPWGENLIYVVVVADAGHSLVGFTGAWELRISRWVKNVTIKA